MKTFAGIPVEFAGADRSKVSLIPVAYDGTSTWVKGADKGPEAFLDAAENMELYDIETQSEVYKEGVYLHQTLQGFSTPMPWLKPFTPNLKTSIHAVNW